MAKDKKSFLLYCDLIHTFEELSDEEAGKLVKHIFRYVNDKNPKSEDRLVKVAFEPIRQQLKRDLKKYEDIKQKNSDNARKRWDAKHATASEPMRTDAKHADSDNGTDSDSDNGIKRERAFAPPAKEDVCNEMMKTLDDFTAMGEAGKFINHYESNGWKIGGRAKMKSWKAAVRQWLGRMSEFKHNGRAGPKNGEPVQDLNILYKKIPDEHRV